MNTFLILLAVVALANLLVGPAYAHIVDGDEYDETKAKMWVYLMAFSVALIEANGSMFA